MKESGERISSDFILKHRTKIFWIFTFFWALIYMLVIPPFESPDEPNHYFRANQVGLGSMIPVKTATELGGVIGRNIRPEAVAIQYDIPYHSDHHLSFKNFGVWWTKNSHPEDPATLPSGEVLTQKQMFVGYANTSLYSPVPYIPVGLAIFTGRLAALTIPETYYLSRTANLIFCLTLLFFLFKWTEDRPREQIIFFLVANLPMSMNLIGAVSADPVLITSSWLMAACGYRLCRRWDPKFFLLYAFLAAVISLCKGVYVVLPMSLGVVVLLDRTADFASRLKRIAAVLACALIPSMVWGAVSSQLFVPIVPNVDPQAQIQFVLHHPFLFLSFVLKEYWQHGGRYLEQSIGVLGWLDTRIPEVAYSIFALLMLTAATLRWPEENLKNERADRFTHWSFVTAIATIGLITLAMYVTWNPVGATQVDGIQGRYFLPLLPYLLFLLPRTFRLKGSQEGIAIMTILALLFMLEAASVAKVFSRYWVA